MKKFRINELTTNGDSSSSGHHGVRSPSSVSLVSSASIPAHSTDRLTLTNNVTSITMHPPDQLQQQRTSPFYHHETDHISTHNDNINWRDEADGSEEDESRVNAVTNVTNELPTTNLQSNLFGQHNNLPIHPQTTTSFTNMVEQNDFHDQTLNNTNETNRPFISRNIDSNNNEKLIETEFYINKVEDLLNSFKNLLKTKESIQNNCGTEENIYNIFHSNFKPTSSRKNLHASSKITNNSNLFNHSRVSNQFVPASTIQKNTQTSEQVEDKSRNNKNKKFSNNRQTIQTDFLSQNGNNSNTTESDFIINESLSNDGGYISDDRIEQFYRLMNVQINVLRKKLEQLFPFSDIKDVFAQNNPSNDSFSTSNQQQHLLNDVPLCDINSLPAEFHSNIYDDNFCSHFRTYNQQIYQLLLTQNNQINQQHQLIQLWMDCQHKWLEKLSQNSFKFALNNTQVDSQNLANNLLFNDQFVPMNNYHQSQPNNITLNNQTEPRRRTNNFQDNFRSLSFQNNFQTREMGSTASQTNNCSNSCGITSCNKNNRHQSFAGFGTQKPPFHNQFVSNHSSIQVPHFGINTNPNGITYLIEKKINNNADNNIQQLNKLLSMVGKIVEPEPASNSFNSNIQNPGTSKMSISNSRCNLPPSSIIFDNKNSCKRKKTTNMINVEVPVLNENADQFDDEDHDSIDMEEPSPFDQISRGNQSNELRMLNNPSTSANQSVGPTNLPPFHLDKCNFQVPYLSPQTGAIRKKPIDCNFKFSATDNQKLSMQHHSQVDNVDISSSTFVTTNSTIASPISSESIRPLMPAEGRSSETSIPNQSLINVSFSKSKLSNSSQKYSTRPPITGAGNESSFSPQTFVKNPFSNQKTSILDDDIKWSKLNSESKSISFSDKITSKNEESMILSSCDRNNLAEIALINGVESSVTSLDSERQLEGSTDFEVIASLPVKESCDTTFGTSAQNETNFNQSTSTTSSGLITLVNNNIGTNKSLSSCETEIAESNENELTIGANGRFIPDEVIRNVNGQGLPDSADEDLDDKDTDVRLLTLAGNAVEVRSTVRLSGDGEQGL